MAMLLRRFTDFILQGRVQAISVAFLSAFIPVIGGVSILIAVLVTLRKGAIEGGLVLLAASLPVGLGLIYRHESMPNDVQITMFILGIVILSHLLTWFFAIILRQFNSWSMTLEFAVLLSVLVIGILHLFFPDIQDWWVTKLNDYFTKAKEITGAVKDVSSKLQAIGLIKPFLTGLFVIILLLNALLQLLLARWWQAVIFNPGGLRKELYQVRLSYMAGIVFIVGLMFAYFNNEFALDELPVLFMAFFVAGMCLLHQLTSTAKNSWVWLLLIYTIVFLLFPLSIIIIAFVALCDTGLDFRKRLIL